MAALPVSTLLTLSLSLTVSAAFTCKFTLEKHSFDLTPLTGTQVLWTTWPTPPTVENSTIFLDLCAPLKWDKSFAEDDRCEDGTQGTPLSTETRLSVVCVIRYTQRGEDRTVHRVIPVAGTFPGHDLDANTSIIRGNSNPEEVQGVNVKLHGQVYEDQVQSAIFNLACDDTVEVVPPAPKTAWG